LDHSGCSGHFLLAHGDGDVGGVRVVRCGWARCGWARCGVCEMPLARCDGGGEWEGKILR
jgi:hypothetical protein